MFVKVTNGTAVRYTLGLLRRENPNVSFPKEIPEETLREYGVYPLNDTPPPQYNTVTQNIQETFTESNGAWYRTWSVIDKPAEEAEPLLLQKIASDRYLKESEGLVWTDSQNEQWFIDTTTESQNRIANVLVAIQQGKRADNGVWKCAKIVGETTTLTFRPTTNAELITIGELVHDHVQKCFDAEAAASAKVLGGDYNVSFDAEFESLE